MDKVVATAGEAVADVPTAHRWSVGGFAGLSGVSNVRDPGAVASAGPASFRSVVSNNGRDGLRLAVLPAPRAARLRTGSYIGANKEFARQYPGAAELGGDDPAGHAGERLRVGGAGISSLHPEAGWARRVADGGLPWRATTVPAASRRPRRRRRSREFDGARYVLERGIRTDASHLVRAAKGDRRTETWCSAKSSRTQPARGDGRDGVTAAEVEELGSSPARSIRTAVHLPGICAAGRRADGERAGGGQEDRAADGEFPMAGHEQMAARVPGNWWDGQYVNLGIGPPDAGIGTGLPQGVEVTLESENGIPAPAPVSDRVPRGGPRSDQRRQGRPDPPGASFFDSALSFGMIRAALDVAVLGPCRSRRRRPGQLGHPGQDNIRDRRDLILVHGARTVIVVMTHTAKDGSPTILQECAAAHGKACVNRVITDLGVST